jgi:ABC-2 type transport system ATP-binding protein
MSVLTVMKLEKTFKVGFIPKPQKVLHGVSFSIQPGQVTAFLGGNGAGKTTTLRCVLGLARFDSGQVEFFGEPGLSKAARKKIGFLPERPYFYEYLTGLEFLRFYGQLSGLSRARVSEKSEQLLKRVDLWSSRDKRLRSYSKGMLQKIGLAQALIHDPEFVILDEPMSGLDPDGRFYVADIIRQAASEGKTIFFSSHLLPDAEKLCQSLVILKQGRVIYEGSTDAFLARMGDSTVISYTQNDRRSVETLATRASLNARIAELQRQGAEIFEVRPERNLEDAFVKLGLRGEP